MKLLSAKNKKYFNTAMIYFGMAVLFAVVYRAFKSGAKGAGEIAKSALAEIQSILTFKNLLVLLGFGIAFIADSVTGMVSFGTLAVALGTLTTGAAVVSTFNTTYVPKTFFYVAATQLTGVKITVQGDGVIYDSDANGLTHTGVSRLLGGITNGYTIRLANSFISGKNVIWEFTNSAAQTPTVYVDSDETEAPGNRMYLQTLRQAVLANSGQNFSDFATLSLPSLGATDIVNILYRDGTQQQLNRADIQARLQYIQNTVNTPIYTIDNFGMKIKTVNVLAAAQTAYVQRWVPVVSKGMINQTINQ